MKRITILILIALLCFSIWRYWQHSTNYVGVDYYQLWMVGRYFKDTHGEKINFYRNEQKIGSHFYHSFRMGLRKKYGDYILLDDVNRIPFLIDKEERKLFNVSGIRRSPKFYSSPFLFYFISLFCLDDYSNSFKLFSSISLLCFIFGSILLFRLLRFDFRLSLLLLVAVLWLYFPLIRSQQSGNVNELAFLPFMLYLYLSCRSNRGICSFLAGFFLVISVGIKPLTILVCIYESIMSLKGKLKSANLFLGMICAALAIYIITSSYYGFSIWAEWWRKIPELATDSLYYTQPMKVENYSFLMALDFARYIAILAPVGLLFAIYFIKKLRIEFLNDRFFAAPLLIIVALLIDKLVWAHYFIFLVIVFAAILKNILKMDMKLQKAICAAVLVVLFLVMGGFFRAGLGYYLFSFTPLLLGLLYIYTAYKRGVCYA